MFVAVRGALTERVPGFGKTGSSTYYNRAGGADTLRRTFEQAISPIEQLYYRLLQPERERCVPSWSRRMTGLLSDYLITLLTTVGGGSALQRS